MKTTTINKLIEAIMHYHATGKHKQVNLRYNPESRTEFEFSSWKHERDHHSPRAILPEDILVSKDGNMLVVGFDNRYNLKQFSSQKPQHIRAYRMDRIC